MSTPPFNSTLKPNDQEKRKGKATTMATLARISRRILTRTLSGASLGRSFSAEAVQLAQPSAPPAPVVVYDGASVWNGAVLRGDLNKITVGFCSNVQERCVVHAAWSSPTDQNIWGGKSSVYIWKRTTESGFELRGLPAETSIERFVTIGAYSLLRSCTIEPECIIGQHSILMEGSLVETHSILEAGSVVPPGRRIPSGELWAGNPAKFVRTLSHEEILEIPKLAVAINDLSRTHFSEFLPYSTVYLEVEKMKSSLGISI
ncbi:UNVERIFIED_CONTAM: Gamma carbonic anhydrase-like 2, mitochondrial [Sesamum latifolium]|uniref:Gamma carbonic anhydrase-like 2, mitochondrial n=1 Tax=Sesamum latifolium TaxID=2727402 RepID=A0AAW2YEB3_9LAMI